MNCKFHAQFEGGARHIRTYPAAFLVRPLTNQPRLLYIHLHKFLSLELFYGSQWLQNLNNRLYLFDSPLECCSFSTKWRPALFNFLSPKWFDEVEKREMLTGAEAIYHLLRHFNPQVSLEQIIDKWTFLNRDSSEDQYKINAQDWDHFTQYHPPVNKRIEFFNAAIQSKKNTIIKRFALIKKMSLDKSHPSWTILFNLPVMPPDLRPIMKLKDGQIILSDLNELYRVILARNLAVAQLSIHNLTAMVQKVLLQRAVDTLLGNGIGLTFRDLDNQPYKSIADLLTGKEGRIRENLLGKRVDYSGRSVIVVGPTLNLYQCGLPKEMAIELFQPFIIYYLLQLKLARSPRAAKFMIAKRIPIVWNLLHTVIQNHYIILNRAPTLHRLGVQAFQPILVPDKAIHLHPLVCTGFNADFDGDQMAVHVPLSLEAQAETCMLMSPFFNLLSPATGEAITVPSQDMLLGIYLLTLETNLGVYHRFSPSLKMPATVCYNSTDIFALYNRNPKSELVVWLALPSHVKVTTYTNIEEPLEVQYSLQGNSKHIYEYFRVNIDALGQVSTSYIRTTLGRLLLNQQIEQAIQATNQFYTKM